MSDETPQTIAGYQIDSRLGGGPRGAVYSARRPGGALRALKLFRADLAAAPGFAARLEATAAALAAAAPPGAAEVEIPRVADGRLYQVGELMPAGSLGDLLASAGQLGQGLPVEHALDLAALAAAALAELHAVGVEHGNLKPNNLLLAPAAAGPSGYRLALADAGQAEPVDALVASGDEAAAGLAYASPEWLSDADAGPPADVYALGAILYELLAGRPPFAADSLDAAYLGHLYSPPPPLGPELPAALASLILACLDKRPASRPRAAELSAGLRAIIDPPAEPAPPPAAAPAVETPHAGVSAPAAEAPAPDPPAAPAVETPNAGVSAPGLAPHAGAAPGLAPHAEAPAPDPPAEQGEGAVQTPHAGVSAPGLALPMPELLDLVDPASKDGPEPAPPANPAVQTPQWGVSAPAPEPTPAAPPAEPAFVAADAPPAPGQTVGGCRLEELLGGGGSGSVFRAYHSGLQRSQAIKIVHPSLAASPAFRARFAQAAGAQAALRHPNLIEIFDFGQQSGRVYLTMELMPEGALSGLLQRRARAEQGWPLGLVVDLIRQGADGLAAAHAGGLVHGNLKPSNLLLGRPAGRGYSLKLSDFGLAHSVDEAVSLPDAHLSDFFAYASPEWFQGRPVDARSDIYSLGVILYEAATGYLPFEAREFDSAFVKHVYQAPLPLRQVRPSLPAELETIALRCLAKDPTARYASAGDLADALRGLLQRPDMVLAAPPAAARGPLAGGPAAMPRIQALNQQGQTLRVVDLTGEGVTVGRLPGNDLVLDAEAVAEQHLQIDWDGTRVSVMSLADHATLEGVRLRPQIAQSWSWGTTLRLGPYWLRLDRPGALAPPPTPANGLAPTNGAAPPPPPGPRATQQLAPDGPAEDDERDETEITQPELGDVRVEIIADQKSLTLVPGRPATFQFTLANLDKQVDHYQISAEGVPGHWITVPPATVQLNPGAQSLVTLNLLVPMVAASKAGDYAVTIRARSTRNPEVSRTAQVVWTVQPFHGFGLEMKPRRGRAWRRAAFSLTARNTGNVEERFVLSGSDDEELLTYSFAEDRPTIAAGGSSRLRLKVYNRQLRWFGAGQRHSFTVQMLPEGGGDAKTAAAQLEQTVLISRLMIGIALLALLLAGLPFYGYGGYGPVRVPSFARRLPLWGFLNTATPTQTSTPTPTNTPLPTNTPPPTSTPLPPSPLPIPPPPTATYTPSPVPPTLTPTITPTPTSQALCTSGSSLQISGNGPPGEAFLVYFDGRPVAGGRIDRGGFFSITLQFGRERPGDKPVSVRLRSTGAELRRITCQIPGPPTPTPPFLSLPTAAPTP